MLPIVLNSHGSWPTLLPVPIILSLLLPCNILHRKSIFNCSKNFILTRGHSLDFFFLFFGNGQMSMPNVYPISKQINFSYHLIPRGRQDPLSFKNLQQGLYGRFYLFLGFDLVHVSCWRLWPRADSHEKAAHGFWGDQWYMYWLQVITEPLSQFISLLPSTSIRPVSLFHHLSLIPSILG